MVTLKQLRESASERYAKAKALYDRPGTEGEKLAAKAAMDRIGHEHAEPVKSTRHKRSSGYSRFGSEYEGRGKPEGYYTYNPTHKTYHGPYQKEAEANNHYPHHADNRTVCNSSMMWREKGYDSNPHKFDREATFPHLDKHKNHPDD